MQSYIVLYRIESVMSTLSLIFGTTTQTPAGWYSRAHARRARCTNCCRQRNRCAAPDPRSRARAAHLTRH